MKTIEQLYTELLTNEEKKKELAKALKENKAEEFLKANDCNATVEEAVAYIKVRSTKQGELSDAELDNISGGSSSCTTAKSIFASVGSFGIACAVDLAKGMDDEEACGGEGLIA